MDDNDARLVDAERRLAALEARVASAEEQMRSALSQVNLHQPVINEHEDRLDDHERRLGGLTLLAQETRKVVATLGTDVGRLADADTSNGLMLHRIDSNIAIVLEALGRKLPPESMPTPPLRPHHATGHVEDSGIRKVEDELRRQELDLEKQHPEEPKP